MHNTPANGRDVDGQGGFLLVELVVAISVFAVGIAGIITSYNYGMDKLRTLKETTIAERVIQDEIERLRALPFDQLADCEGAPVAVSNPEFGELVQGTAVLTVAPADAPGLALKQVHVSVRWRGDSGRVIHRSVATFIARRTPGEGSA